VLLALEEAKAKKSKSISITLNLTVWSEKQELRENYLAKVCICLVYTTEYTQSGNDHFLAYIPS
jgi:hypothetical protein